MVDGHPYKSKQTQFGHLELHINSANSLNNLKKEHAELYLDLNTMDMNNHLMKLGCVPLLIGEMLSICM